MKKGIQLQNRKVRGGIIPYRLAANFRSIGGMLARILTVYRVAFFLAGIALALWYFYGLDLGALLPNIVTDLLGVALTVFIVDTMYRIRSDGERKRVLIAKLGSKNNSVAAEALRELNARGWLDDGSLERAFLMGCNLDGNSLTGADLRRVTLSFASLQDTTWFEANLQGASLDHTNLTKAALSMPGPGPHIPEADLSDATLRFANLFDASVRDEQLCNARALWRATMPDGTRYDGRFRLPGDLEQFHKHATDPRDAEEWAQFYGVTLAQYVEGNSWSSEHLTALRGPLPAGRN